METAKVDIRKLQLLNDRINQTIDALCQVRFTVHGLQHTPGINPAMSQVNPLAAFGQGIGYGVPSVGYASPQGLGFASQGLGYIPQAIGYGAVPGFAHTSPISSAFSPAAAASLASIGAIPQTIAAMQSPFAQSAFAASPFVSSAVSPWANPYVSQLVGLSHTTPETDPFWAIRFAQTFPYALFATPPVVSMY